MSCIFGLHPAGVSSGVAHHILPARPFSRPNSPRNQHSLQQSLCSSSRAPTRSSQCCSGVSRRRAMSVYYIYLPPASSPDRSFKPCIAASASSRDHSELWTPPTSLEMPEVQAAGGGAATVSTGYDEHRARTPPPDLPSLLLDSRIVYLGMPVSWTSFM